MTNTPVTAQIYLADQRGYLQTDSLRSYHTFNFGHYYEESREAFRSLRALNDDTLRAGASLQMQVQQDTACMLLPVSGGLQYTSSLAGGALVTDFLEPGQLGILSLTSGMTYTISNPYETEFINFLQIWLNRSPGGSDSNFSQFSFDLSDKNKLLSLFEAESGGRGFIGQYGGRQEGVYWVSSSRAGTLTHAVFAFVLQGAFEFQNRLLHEKDGLALLPIQNETIEFEALSNDAILILLEIP